MARHHLRTPLGRVLGLGSAHHGTEVFWRQRLTAIANIPLVIAFIVILVTLVGRPPARVVEALGSPFIALVFLLLIVSVTIHMRIGMQTIIEDYVHHEGLKGTALVANTLFSFAVAAVAIFAVLKLAFGAA